MIRREFVLGIIAVALSAPAGAGEALPFESVWRSIARNSDEKIASSLETGAAIKAEERASRHWLPRVYLNGRAYVTDDPAQTFMGELNQRQIRAEDFNPSALNQPGSNVFGTAAFGLDLPFYEGGAGVSGHAAATQRAEAARSEEEAGTIGLYARAAADYAKLLASGRELKDVRAVAGQVDAVLASYRVGAKVNPVGYAGLLGLKSLQNRISAMSAEAQAELQGARARIAALGKDLPPDWTPVEADPAEFIRAKLPEPAASRDSDPAAVRAAKLSAESAEDAARASKAQTLPRVGLFSELDLNAGSRAAAGAYTAGAYLQWNIFSPQGSGAYDEAKLLAQAASARADAARARSRAARESALGSEAALEESLRALRSSRELQKEQTETSRKLFTAGSLNAMQLAEAYSHSLDVIEAIRKSELGYIDAREMIVNNADFRIPGESHE